MPALAAQARDLSQRIRSINPHADEVEGDTCCHDLKSIPGSVEAVVIATTPKVTETVMQDCAEQGISRVWIHRAFGEGSVSEDATEYCRAHGITVIADGCPPMFLPGADLGHRCMRWALNLTGGLPNQV